uniref:Protein kinase domain-containing protein n=1 Tax=Oryzias melastigma TaxID=30732 RepID=A0A3B3BGB5_ORYME
QPTPARVLFPDGRRGPPAPRAEATPAGLTAPGGSKNPSCGLGCRRRRTVVRRTHGTPHARPRASEPQNPPQCYSAQYLVEKFIGEGSFGKVAKCRNLSTNQEVAVKISKPTRRDAGLDEISALAKITKLDADKYGLIKFIERFEYRHHICIVYELLDQSLLDFMKARKHRPLLIHEIRSIARQLLISLKGLKEINMAHCDIKPDNIMLVNHASEPFRVKLIDFGLTKKPEDIEPGTTMQNIQYRAPEVILGLPLDERVDMWTVGYVLAWLYTGFHIHPADSEYIVIRALTMRQGMPDQELLDQACMSFDDLIQFYQDKTKIREVEMFINLLRQMIEIDPNKRITPEEALKHSFFTMEQPSADSEKSNSQESASPEVHQQPKTTTVPQETAAAPQEKTVKEDVLQQQEATKRNSQAVTSDSCQSSTVVFSYVNSTLSCYLLPSFISLLVFLLLKFIY